MSEFDLTDEQTGYALFGRTHLDHAGCVHPEDRHLVMDGLPNRQGRFSPNHHVFRVGGVGDWAELEYGAERIRVAPDSLRAVPVPGFNIGDIVQVMRDGAPAEATVREMMWHYKHKAPIYLVRVDGKKSGRWYFDADLTLIADATEPS
jgi:hypothetical protein